MTGPLTNPQELSIPVGERRRGVFRKIFPGNKPPGLYLLRVTSQGSIPETTTIPIVRR